ncbi:MAG: hypothetical protein HY544_00130 [Candidatus Diapherotrites archaeon]|uniref:Uncharacterized protein n=1 Tax=Candidatus Iainarchaeum sp. TaxID=3101447 RepID=A0A8T3YHB0_9ARCH|nr:hypothetical protein [Candidatus Diapherotrites archaeon]
MGRLNPGRLTSRTKEPEKAWNAFRFGVTAPKGKHDVKVFLINEGIEAQDIQNKKYNVKEQVAAFIQSNGQILEFYQVVFC